MSDNALIEAISACKISAIELEYLADWHESVAHDKGFHEQLAKSWNQEYDPKSNRDKDRHLKIATALRRTSREQVRPVFKQG